MKYKKLAVYLNYGKKGAGKSLTQAVDSVGLLKEYAKTEKKYPQLKKRILFSSQKLSNEIEKKELHIHLYYWSSIDQLRYCPRIDCWKTKDQGKHPLHDADIMHDEISKDFPAGSWADTPKWVKQLFSHVRKRGLRYIANTQAVLDCDISFKRQLDFVYHIRRIIGSRDVTATLPDPEFIWGLIMKQEEPVDIVLHEADPIAAKTKIERFKEIYGGLFIPEFYLISRKNVGYYDTHEEIPAWKPDRLEHIELFCDDDDCPIHGRNSGKPRYEHRKI